MLAEKFREVLLAVLPVTVMVIILNFAIVPIETLLLWRFLLGAVLIVLGLSIFLVGVDIGITPIGELMGSTITKRNKLWIVIAAGFILGFFISIAEPDLHILAGQIDYVTAGAISKRDIIVIVSIGVAGLLSLGLLRIIKNILLYKMLAALYGIILILCLLAPTEFIAIAFDGSGATTGALTVPFILAISFGVSKLKKDSKASEKDSFGLIGLVSAGAVISVLFASIFYQIGEITASLDHVLTDTPSIIIPFIQKLSVISGEVLLALLPILITFLIFQKISFKLPRKAYIRVLKGILYTYMGLVLFLVGVNAGFMDVGSIIGYNIACLDNQLLLILIGFILGLVTILAEPAVYVLTHQIEDVTSGYVKSKVVMFALSIGVGVAVALSVLRILIPELQLWHYLLPGYIIAISMTYFVPKLFVGIAFDSGGVASGPMTATFILAFIQGVAEAKQGADVLIDGFGMIAMVALTPLIALQILGYIFKLKSVKGGI